MPTHVRLLPGALGLTCFVCPAPCQRCFWHGGGFVKGSGWTKLPDTGMASITSIIVQHHPSSSIIIHHILSSIFIIHHHPLSSAIIHHHHHPSSSIITIIIHHHPPSSSFIHHIHIIYNMFYVLCTIDYTHRP